MKLELPGSASGLQLCYGPYAILLLVQAPVVEAAFAEGEELHPYGFDSIGAPVIRARDIHTLADVPRQDFVGAVQGFGIRHHGALFTNYRYDPALQIPFSEIPVGHFACHRMGYALYPYLALCFRPPEAKRDPVVACDLRTFAGAKRTGNDKPVIPYLLQGYKAGIREAV